MSTVPHSDIKIDAREKSTFGDSQENTARDEALKVVYKSHKCHDESPRHHDEGDPDTRAEAFHHHITRDFREHIEGKEYCKRNIEVQSFHTKIDFKVNQFGVANIGAVEEAKPKERVST